MAMEIAETSRILATRLLSANAPKVDGIIPGSVRSVVTTVDGNTGSFLRINKKYPSIAVQELSGDRATLGGQAEIVIRCTAQKADGMDITGGDNISLREEAPTLIWNMLQMSVNNVPLNQCERADVVRHAIDRLFTSAARYQGQSPDRGPYTYRQLGRDSTLNDLTSTSRFKKDIITDGKTFELIRPLDDLPLLGAWDGVVPGFLSMTLDATVGDPSAIFIVPVDEETSPPRIVIETIEVRTRTVRLMPEVAKVLEEMWSAGELTMNVDTWTATQIPPQIAAGSSSFKSNTALAMSSTPDILAFIMFPSSTFTPSGPSWESGHPLLHTWNGVRTFLIKDKGECIKAWYDLDRTKSPAFASVVEALETGAGTHPGTGTSWAKDSLDSEAFDDGTTGALVLAFRNWLERSPHDITPVDLRFDATFEAPTPETVSLFAVHKTRHQWLFSAISGASRLV